MRRWLPGVSAIGSRRCSMRFNENDATTTVAGSRSAGLRLPGTASRLELGLLPAAPTRETVGMVISLFGQAGTERGQTNACRVRTDHFRRRSAIHSAQVHRFGCPLHHRLIDSAVSSTGCPGMLTHGCESPTWTASSCRAALSVTDSRARTASIRNHRVAGHRIGGYAHGGLINTRVCRTGRLVASSRQRDRPPDRRSPLRRALAFRAPSPSTDVSLPTNGPATLRRSFGIRGLVRPTERAKEAVRTTFHHVWPKPSESWRCCHHPGGS
jgi:hypothetical protein